MEHNSVLAECLEVLDAHLLSYYESERTTALFEALYPLTDWGKVEWSLIESKKEIHNYQEIIPEFQKMLCCKIAEDVFILTDNGMLPIIKANLTDILNNFNLVYPLSSCKFIFNLDQGYIIEILSAYGITIGLIEKGRISLCAHLRDFLEALQVERFHNKYDMRWIHKLLNPFVQPKYWNIGDPYYVKSGFDIIPSIETLLKKLIQKDVLLLWEDKQFPIVETNLEGVIPLWDMLIKIKTPFQIIALNGDYRNNVGAEGGATIITVNFGLKSK